MTNEAGLEFGTIADGTVSINKYREPTDAQRQAALNAADHAVNYSAELGLDDDDYVETCPIKLREWKTIRSALQSPRVPVIPGLDEAIEYFENDGQDKEQPYAITWGVKMATMLQAARAYAELQKGV